MSSLRERLDELEQRKRSFEEEQHSLKIEAHQRLNEVEKQIENLEVERDQLRGILGVEIGSERAGHGELKQICLEILKVANEGMTSSQVRDEAARRYPDTNLASLPATLSYQAKRGNVWRDERGRYHLYRD